MKKSKMTAVIVAMCILLTSVAGTITASAEVNNYQNKLSPQLIEEINTSDEETICVYISLLPCTSEAEIEKLVSEKYTWSDDDEYLKYYRQELSNVIGAYVQQFVDNNADLLNNILVQPNSAEFVIAEVSKTNVNELAKLDIVRDIDIWNDTIEVISEDETDDSYLSKISEELLAKMNASDSVPVYISLKPCTSESEIEKLVSEKYTWATEDEHLMYYRKELASVVGAYVQEFIDSHSELFEEILVQPNSSEFVIAKATKDSIINLAKLDTVNDIDYWDDTIEVISEDEPDEFYRNAFIEWSVSKNGKECLANGYQYKELYHHYSDNKLAWVLVSARYLLPETDVETWIYIGGRSIMSGSLCAPFKCCYGIYDVEQNNFYDLADLTENYSKYNGLIETLEALNIGTQSGDTPDNDFRNNFVEWSVSQNGESCLTDGYQYKELYRHYSDNTLDWVLVDAKYLLPEPDVETWIHIGGRNIMSGSLCAPFKCCYGIYYVEENTFYDLGDLAKDYSKYDGLIETLEALKIGNLTGDVNLDNTVSISDVTSIQRKLAEYEKYSSYQCGLSDVNKDGEVTIADATAIQLYLAQLITDFG